jgi:hypothetical protein
MNWVKNWWVLICIRFTCTTGWSPTATVALSHRRQYIEDRQSEPIELLSVLSGDFQSFDEILAEDRLKTIALLRKLRHRGTWKVEWVFTFACAAYNLVRMRDLLAATVPAQ